MTLRPFAPLFLCALTLGCTGDVDPTDTADTDDTAATDTDDTAATDTDDTASTDTDTGDTDTGTPVDTDACTDEVDATLALYDVQGDLTGSWSCSTGFSSQDPYLRFEDTATGRLVASSEGSGFYRVALPAGTYRVLLDGCGLIEQDQAGGTFLVEPALVVTGDLDRNLALVGSDRTGEATDGSTLLDSDWMWTMLHFYPVSGTQLPQRALDAMADGDDYFDSYEVPVWDGDFEAFLPSGTYWVAFGTRTMGPVTVSGAAIDLDFPAVDTVVHLVTNGTETEGVVHIRPQGAPGDLIRALAPDGTRSYPLVPGTYDVWVTESEEVWDYQDSVALVPALLGIASKPGGLVVNASGTATITLTLDEVTVDVTCDGQPFEGDVGFLPDGLPGDVTEWFGPYSSHFGYLPAWDGALEAGVVPGSTGRLYLDDLGGCGTPVKHTTLSPSQGHLALGIDLVDVTLDVRVDGVAPSANDITLYSIDLGRYTSKTDGMPPAEYLVLVRRADGAVLEKRVTLSTDGTVQVNLTTFAVTVDRATSGGAIPSWYEVDARFTPLADAGTVQAWNRVSVADPDTATIRLVAGTYEVAFAPHDEDWYYDVPLVDDGICVEVGP